MVHPFLVSIPKAARTSLFLLARDESAGRPEEENSFQKFHNALCAVRKVYFSAQPNNLKLILNFQKYYPIEHIFVPACSSARKIHFFKF